MQIFIIIFAKLLWFSNNLEAVRQGNDIIQKH